MEVYGAVMDGEGEFCGLGLGGIGWLIIREFQLIIFSRFQSLDLCMLIFVSLSHSRYLSLL